MSKYTKEELQKYILVENLSYEEIGRLYGITGAAIKKAAKKYAIPLVPRRKVSDTEDFSHGGSLCSIVKCMCCGNEFRYSKSHALFCSHTCEKEYQHQQYILRWKEGKESGTIKKNSYVISKHLRRYLFEKFNNKCQSCGWGEVNSFTRRIPLQIHHVDGNYANNKEDNLQLLCPNCHSLTENFGSRNKKDAKDRTKYFGRNMG